MKHYLGIVAVIVFVVLIFFLFSEDSEDERDILIENLRQEINNLEIEIDEVNQEYKNEDVLYAIYSTHRFLMADNWEEARDVLTEDSSYEEYGDQLKIGMSGAQWAWDVENFELLDIIIEDDKEVRVDYFVEFEKSYPEGSPLTFIVDRDVGINRMFYQTDYDH